MVLVTLISPQNLTLPLSLCTLSKPPRLLLENKTYTSQTLRSILNQTFSVIVKVVQSKMNFPIGRISYVDLLCRSLSCLITYRNPEKGNFTTDQIFLVYVRCTLEPQRHQ